MTDTLLIASGNPGKLLEFQAILDGFPVTLILPKQIGLDLDVVEDGLTYAENAAIKARAYADASGLPVLADDSGLEVVTLDGAPGLYSARYAPDHGATDADRRALLLRNLRGQPRPWTARFHCTVAVKAPEAGVRFADGICPGEIIPEERGSNGFGYDPIFLLPEFGLTMAELSMEQKNRISHRARAVLAALPILREIFNIT